MFIKPLSPVFLYVLVRYHPDTWHHNLDKMFESLREHGQNRSEVCGDLEQVVGLGTS